MFENIRFGQRDSSATSCSKLVSDYELNNNNEKKFKRKNFFLQFFFPDTKSYLHVQKFENKLNILLLVP